MTEAIEDQEAYAAAERLLGAPLVLPLGPGEPEAGKTSRDLLRGMRLEVRGRDRAWTPAAAP